MQPDPTKYRTQLEIQAADAAYSDAVKQLWNVYWGALACTVGYPADGTARETAEVVQARLKKGLALLRRAREDVLGIINSQEK